MTPPVLDILAYGAEALAAAGSLQSVAALGAVRRFMRETETGSAPDRLPPLTLLKPLHGDEPLLEDALATFCAQDYPAFQIVFGVQRNDDPAIAVVARLRARFPELDTSLVVDGSRHGPNRKVDNLINMLAHAKHEALVISDADIHAEPGLLRSIARSLEGDGVGLVTTLYTGLPASRLLPRLLGAAQINQVFLPGALLGRALGRQDCLGAVMALTATTLASIGGLPTLSPHLADDAVLGRKVRALGLRVVLARSVPATSVVETTLSELVSHELRWGRTVRGQAPIGYPLTTLQTPIAWALLAACFSLAAPWSLLLLAVVWATRHSLGRAAERLLLGRAGTPFWITPIRDSLSLGIILLSYAGGHVAWRGHRLHISAQRNIRAEAAPKPRPVERPIERPIWRSAN